MADADPRRWQRLWRLGLLAFVLCTSVGYVLIGARAHDNFQNDSAYYFGVARHIARTWRFEEPIVWHYLRPPATIVHPAFDYWGGLTSLVLVPFLAIFGATEHVAFIVMALISAASLLAVWHLVCVSAPCRHPLPQLLAVVLFAFSPGMAGFRFDTESIPLYHLLLVLSLIAFARARYALATLLAALLVYTRPDGAFVAVAVFIASAAMLRKHPPADPKRAWGWLFGAAFGAAGVWTAYNLVAFGTPVTTASRALFVFGQDELYAFGAHPGYTPEKLGILLSAKYLSIRLMMIVQALRISRLVPYSDVWLALALVPGLVCIRRSTAIATLIWATLIAAGFLVIWSEPAVFAPWRSFHPLLPLLVVGGAQGLDTLLELCRRWPLPASAIALVPAVFLVAKLSIYRDRALAMNHDEIAMIRSLDPLLDARPVASDLPWYVMSTTRSPAISIPSNGEPAMIAAFEKYRVQWLLFGGIHTSTLGSRSTLEAIANGKQTTLGAYRLERVPAGAGVQLFRLLAAP